MAYAVQEAERLYHLEGGELVWREPEAENVYVEVWVCDGADGWFIPRLAVYVLLIDSLRNLVGTRRRPFLSHLYRYGRNWSASGGGEYTPRVRIEAADLHGHDEISSRRYAEPIEVAFKGIRTEVGESSMLPGPLTAPPSSTE